MTPAMTMQEIDFFKSVLQCCTQYLEFGSGGSTLLACELAKESVICVDSSQEWLIKVAAECDRIQTRLQPKCCFTNIGPIKNWGWPRDETMKDKWSSYVSDVWPSHPRAIHSDVFFVDGRFRVACFLQILLKRQTDCVILIHDFMVRPQYHCINEFANEIARAENLSLFAPKAKLDIGKCESMLSKFMSDPN